MGKGFMDINKRFKFLNDSYSFDIIQLENKLISLIEHAADTFDTGLKFLPQSERCRGRVKRSLKFDVEEDKVNTYSLFPQLGKMFSWVTGNLDSSAGKIINLNYHNVEQLQNANKKVC